ncbi:prephenate dehydrogenase [Pelomicrobium sp. G1]|uniref:prephenate dehydrogenase n=1 Tax=unclassified Pelomicrobium TaxID=2815318 RepID=UPI003F771C09
MRDVRLKKLVVAGVGLIGGSFALALKAAGRVERVVGVGRSSANLERALAAGVVDETAGSLETALPGADLVLLAAPVGQNARLIARLAAGLDGRTLVTDAGSTKQDVVAITRKLLGHHLPRFVPAHPIAGAEKSGAGAATAALYRDRTVVLTPLPETDPQARDTVRALWEACGARVVEMAPERHDRILAAVSHLPHLLAFALMDLIAGEPEAETLLRFAGPGFRDVTRIAASSPEMWRDVCLANRATLLELIDAYRSRLDEVRGRLAQGDGEGLERLFTRAREARQRLDEEA